MQRKPGFPLANCNIKMPDTVPASSNDAVPAGEEDCEQPQKRLCLINYAHTQWGFNNWSWTVTRQELDFVDFANGNYCAGVVAFVCVTVKNLDIHRENIGYATFQAPTKGSAIHKSRKCAVTNALRETLLSFGGNFTTELMKLLETNKGVNNIMNQHDPLSENNQNLANKPLEPKNVAAVKNIRNDSTESSTSNPINLRSHLVPPIIQPVMKNGVVSNPPLPIAKAHPIPANLPPAANRPALAANAPRPSVPPAPHLRPNSNVSFVLQPVMGGVVPPLYAQPSRVPQVPPPHLYPNTYYEYSGPWHFTYEAYDRHHGNVNLNFNIPPKNLVVNSRAGSVECKNACGVRQGLNGPEIDPNHFGSQPQNQGCWIKPTIFYDGFWTEQKVKKWVAEQVEKQFPEEILHKVASPTSGQPESISKS